MGRNAMVRHAVLLSLGALLGGCTENKPAPPAEVQDPPAPAKTETPKPAPPPTPAPSTPPPATGMPKDPATGVALALVPGGAHRFDKIMDKGFLDPYLPGDQQGEADLEIGRFKARDGKLKLTRGGLSITGSGRDQTVIDGDIVLTGNGYTLSGFTLNGDLYLRGNKCTIDIDIQGKKDIAGTGNTVK